MFSDGRQLERLSGASPVIASSLPGTCRQLLITVLVMAPGREGKGDTEQLFLESGYSSLHCSLSPLHGRVSPSSCTSSGITELTPAPKGRTSLALTLGSATDSPYSSLFGGALMLGLPMFPTPTPSAFKALTSLFCLEEVPRKDKLGSCL